MNKVKMVDIYRTFFCAGGSYTDFDYAYYFDTDSLDFYSVDDADRFIGIRVVRKIKEET